MAVLKAFRALRPTPEYASKVAALPYDVMNSDEARRMVFVGSRRKNRACIYMSRPGAAERRPAL